MTVCPTCEEPFRTLQGMRQHHSKVHGTSLPNRECQDCGMEFYDPKSRLKFCQNCQPNSGRNNGNWKNARETTHCVICDSEFEYYPSDTKGMYCPDCVESADGLLPETYPKRIPRAIKNCRECGAEIRILPSRVAQQRRGFFCDMDCYGNWLSENVIGEAHHQWQGGTIAYGKRWWRTRRSALDRDNHRCQRCGVTASELGQEPDVHHIVPVREFDRPVHAHTIGNVISLCRSCHRIVEESSNEEARLLSER